MWALLPSNNCRPTETTEWTCALAPSKRWSQCNHAQFGSSKTHTMYQYQTFLLVDNRLYLTELLTIRWAIHGIKNNWANYDIIYVQPMQTWKKNLYTFWRVSGIWASARDDFKSMAILSSSSASNKSGISPVFRIEQTSSRKISCYILYTAYRRSMTFYDRN